MLHDEMIKYRAKHNLSQKDFAGLCKVSVQTVNSVEAQKQTPSKLTTEKIRMVIDSEEETDE